MRKNSLGKVELIVVLFYLSYVGRIAFRTFKYLNSFLFRALDNQLYVAAVSPARDTNATYCAWGHSTVVGPWLV